MREKSVQAGVLADGVDGQERESRMAHKQHRKMTRLKTWGESESSFLESCRKCQPIKFLPSQKSPLHPDSMTTTTPTLDQLKRGIAIAEQIEALKSELDGILGHSSAPAKPAPAQGDGRKGKRSAATIAKMKAAQQARWAKVKAPAPAKTPVQEKKGGMSAAGKAKIAAAQKARWAKIKAAKAPVASKAPAKEKADAPAKKRTMSPEARAKIAAAQKARWAAKKK